MKNLSKKNIFSAFLAISATAIVCLSTSGCRAGYVPNNAFAGTLPGLIFTETTHPSYVGEKLSSVKDVEILGDVRGEATAVDMLLICSLGDCGLEAAKAQALSKYPGADDILNVEVDTKFRSILSVINSVTTIVRGKAVKYKK